MVNLENILTNLKSLVPMALAVAGTIVFVVIARYLIKKQSVRISSYRFRQQILTFVLSLIGILIIILVLPISDSLRGQLLSLFGILIAAALALSATTFMGNIMAGLMLRAVRSFRTGDFISVGGHFGRISERGLFHIEIQTEFRDLITMPNLYLVTNPVKVIRSSGTIISAEISLSYDISRKKIEKLLLGAAEEAGLNESFVHVTDLGDFAVKYRIAGLLEEVKQIISARSRLRELMLDKLHAGGVEIVSPTFMNTKAIHGDKTFIPKSAPAEHYEDVTKPAPRAEKVAFDKADQAESLEKLKTRFDKLAEDIKNAESELDKLDDPITREKTSEQIERLKRSREKLDEYIKKRESEEE
jgi:small-conductance mechanosensitive channel